VPVEGQTFCDILYLNGTPAQLMQHHRIDISSISNYPQLVKCLPFMAPQVDTAKLIKCKNVRNVGKAAITAMPG